MSANRKARHKRPTPNRARQGMALGVTTVVSAGAVVAGAGVAQAADTPVSQSRGWFLSGSALGVNLDDIVELDSASARNTGGATDTQLNPLGATLLKNLHVPLGPVNLLEGNGLLTLGAVNQAAIARANGSAIGASGAVSDSGAIGVDSQSNVPASTAKLDLGGLLGTNLGNGLTDGLLDVDLIVGAISANAKQAETKNDTQGKQEGDYRIADLKLNLQSPLLAGLLGTLNLGGQQSQLTGLDTAISGLNLNSLLGGLLGGLLGTPTVTAGNLPVLADIVAAQDTQVGDGAVSIDLSNGKITVDVEKLLQSLGLDLNNLPPNTELVRLILDALTDHVGDLVKDVLNDLTDDITSAIGNITYSGTALPLLGLPVPQVLDPAQLKAALSGPVLTLLDPVLDPVTDLLGDVAGPLLDPLFDALEDLLSIRVNVQNTTGGTFTERAIQIRVLPGANNLATVNLASATVGPGSGQVAGEEDDDETTDNGNPLPATGADDASAPLAAMGLAMVLAGAAATAGAGRMGNGPVGAHAGTRGRGSRNGGRHAKR
jgi:hypothetical protein